MKKLLSREVSQFFPVSLKNIRGEEESWQR
jgi:hypothetical protein